MTKRADLGLSSRLSTKGCSLLKMARKWFAECENDKTCWFPTENVCSVQIRALCWKQLKNGVPRAKMTKRAKLGLKTLFFTNSCTLLKTLKPVVPSADITKRAYPG